MTEIQIVVGIMREEEGTMTDLEVMTEGMTGILTQVMVIAIWGPGTETEPDLVDHSMIGKHLLLNDREKYPQKRSSVHQNQVTN